MGFKFVGETNYMGKQTIESETTKRKDRLKGPYVCEISESKEHTVYKIVW